MPKQRCVDVEVRRTIVPSLLTTLTHTHSNRQQDRLYQRCYTLIGNRLSTCTFVDEVGSQAGDRHRALLTTDVAGGVRVHLADTSAGLCVCVSENEGLGIQRRSVETPIRDSLTLPT